MDNINPIHEESKLGPLFFHIQPHNFFYTFVPQGHEHWKILIKIRGLTLFFSKIAEAQKVKGDVDFLKNVICFLTKTPSEFHTVHFSFLQSHAPWEEKSYRETLVNVDIVQATLMHTCEYKQDFKQNIKATIQAGKSLVTY